MEKKGDDIYYLKIAPTGKKINLVAKESPDSDTTDILL
jgi:hypothetical protein